MHPQTPESSVKDIFCSKLVRSSESRREEQSVRPYHSHQPEPPAGDCRLLVFQTEKPHAFCMRLFNKQRKDLRILPPNMRCWSGIQESNLETLARWYGRVMEFFASAPFAAKFYCRFFPCELRMLDSNQRIQESKSCALPLGEYALHESL